MSRLLLLSLVSAVAAAVLAAPAMTAGNSLGPPGGTIYAFDQAYRTIATPTSLPNRGAFDTIYVFPNCASCASVSEAAPGHPGYNGGRWKVVQAFGITSQLTNAGAVVAAASSLVDTGIRFVCPLIRA
ncbi:MAG: hypothetical protein H0V11_07765 [Actinobacteria bacterium]|nr:hypothetical protein [Actinomycetota bacterium]